VNAAQRFDAAAAGAGVDVLGHHVLAQVVVDHVAAVLVDEAYALLRARRGVQPVPLEPRGRAGGVDLAVDVAAGRVVTGVREPIDEAHHGVVVRGTGRVEAGGGKDHLAFERQAIGWRKRHLDAEVRRPPR
jgi:hypothetical protein